MSTARLSKEKSSLLSRAGCCSVTTATADGVDDGGCGGGGEGGARGAGDGGDGGKGVGVKELAGEEAMRALLREKEQVAADMERQKERLQARCRELQVGKRGGGGGLMMGSNVGVVDRFFLRGGLKKQ